MEVGEEVNREKQEVEEMNNRKEKVEMEEAVLSSIYRCICQASHPLRIVRVKKMRGSMTW